MPFFHISPRFGLKKLTPRVVHRIRTEENDRRKVICAAKSIAACLALIPDYDGELAVYELPDDGKWFQSDYPHPEAYLEYRRLSPVECKYIGTTHTKTGRCGYLRRGKTNGAAGFKRLIARCESDRDFDCLLLSFMKGRDDLPPPPKEVVNIATDNPTGRLVNGYPVKRVIRIKSNGIVALALESFHDNRTKISFDGGETWWYIREAKFAFENAKAFGKLQVTNP